MPPGCPTKTIERRLKIWREARVFQRWAMSLLADYGAAHGPCFMDATFIRSRTKAIDVGLTRHGKGSKLQVICDYRSVPVAWRLTSAGPSEARTAVEFLSELSSARCPDILVMDKAYRAKFVHALASSRGIRTYAPQQRRDRRPNGSDRSLRLLYAQRWRVERLFAWLSAFDRLNCRRERSPAAFGAWLALAMGHIINRARRF